MTKLESLLFDYGQAVLYCASVARRPSAESVTFQHARDRQKRAEAAVIAHVAELEDAARGGG